jgi:hypothetical protein
VQEYLKNKQTKKPKAGAVLYVCNPGDSGGRDQEDRGSKPAQANSSQDPISKNPTQKKKRGTPPPHPTLVEWLKVYALSSSLRTAIK